MIKKKPYGSQNILTFHWIYCLWDNLLSDNSVSLENDPICLFDNKNMKSSNNHLHLKEVLDDNS